VSFKFTRYFLEQVQAKRPYLRQEWLELACRKPVKKIVQEDGRIRLWIMVEDTDDAVPRALRVVLLDDGETIHNAFFDRDFEI
jgi:hypothetical protein